MVWDLLRMTGWRQSALLGVTVWLLLILLAALGDLHLIGRSVLRRLAFTSASLDSVLQMFVCAHGMEA